MDSARIAGVDYPVPLLGYGPAWYETECGLACFRLWELSGGANDVTAAALRRVDTPAQMRRLVDPHH